MNNLWSHMMTKFVKREVLEAGCGRHKARLICRRTFITHRLEEDSNTPLQNNEECICGISSKLTADDSITGSPEAWVVKTGCSESSEWKSGNMAVSDIELWAGASSKLFSASVLCSVELCSNSPLPQHSLTTSSFCFCNGSIMLFSEAESNWEGSGSTGLKFWSSS